jgi:hypothetical protein
LSQSHHSLSNRPHFIVPSGVYAYDALVALEPALGIVLQSAPALGHPNRHLLLYGDVYQVSVTNTIHKLQLVLPQSSRFGYFRRLVERLSIFSDFCEGQSFVLSLGDRTFSQQDDNLVLQEIAGLSDEKALLTISRCIPYIPFQIRISRAGGNPLTLEIEKRSKKVTVNDVIHRYARTDSVVLFGGKPLIASQRLDVLISGKSPIEIVSVRRIPQSVRDLIKWKSLSMRSVIPFDRKEKRRKFARRYRRW